MKNMTLLFFSLFTIVSFGQEFTENVYFDVDEFKLTPEAKKTLDELLPSIQNRNLQITGYTDSTGSISYNLALSKKRAQSVSDYLVLNGINGKNLKPILAKGETTSASTLAQNRRVLIVVFNINVIQPEVKEEHTSKARDGEITQETIDNVEIGTS